MTNEVGTIVENTTFGPYGNILAGGATTRFDYEGKEYSPITGDYDFNFRKYCSEFHIFCQPDTLIQNVYDPQTLNRYMFERGNPQKNTDETGHYFSGALAAIAILFVIALFITDDTLTPIQQHDKDVAEHLPGFPEDGKRGRYIPMEPTISAADEDYKPTIDDATEKDALKKLKTKDAVVDVKPQPPFAQGMVDPFGVNRQKGSNPWNPHAPSGNGKKDFGEREIRKGVHRTDYTEKRDGVTYRVTIVKYKNK